jgi:multiple sugar transport system permease protein
MSAQAKMKTGFTASRRGGTVFIYALLGIVGMFVLLPFLWEIATSFRTTTQVLKSITVFWPEEFYLGNWPEALSKFPFFLYLRNTLIITVPPILFAIGSSLIVAFGFTRFKTRWTGILFSLMLTTMMVPGQIITIPIFVIFAKLKWIDTYWPFIIPSLFGGAFEIFLLRQFFKTIPNEMADAAKVDGATELQILWYLYVPLSTAPVAALVVLQFLGRWNDFYGPSIYIYSQDKMVLQQGLNYLMGLLGATLGGGHDTMNNVPWNLLSAAAILTSFPIIVLFFFAQKQFIEGVRFTGMKG